jgi:hypothetical protein
MKYCASCDQTKPESEFARNKGRYDGLQTYCRLCRKQVDKQLYKKDPAKQAERNRLTVLRNKRNTWQYLKEHPCVDCGRNKEGYYRQHDKLMRFLESDRC